MQALQPVCTAKFKFKEPVFDLFGASRSRFGVGVSDCKTTKNGLLEPIF